MTRTAFFDAVRAGILGPKLDVDEVAGCNVILDATADWSKDWIAYALATTYHETGGRMIPVSERGSENYLFNHYDLHGSRPDIAKRLGNTQPGDGVKFKGRGPVQTTGRANYEKMGKRLGIDLISHPEKMLDPVICAQSLRVGMSEGLFTGKKLSDYFSSTARDPVGARRIINGTDRARDIAEYFVQFRKALG